jgi:RNA polymerase sigma-70 factor (ECF subfamily)
MRAHAGRLAYRDAVPDVGENTSFESTFLPLLPDALAFALSLSRNTHDAEDLVQDAFLKAQRAFSSFTPGTNAKAWLFTIVRRLHIDRHRRLRLRPRSAAPEVLEEVAPAPEPDETDWSHVAPEVVRGAIEAVPEPFRLPVRLRDIDGFSYREIAEVLGVPSGTVMSRLHRGREYVRRALVERMHPDGAARPPDAAPPR